MKPRTTYITEFTLWKDNRKDGIYTITVIEAAEIFKQSHFYANFQKGWPFDRALTLFISANESEGGLSSVFEQKDYDSIAASILHEL